MAGKEAVVVILDVGQSMATPINQRGQTRIEAAAEATRLLIQQKLLFAKSHEVGIVIMGSDETENDLNEQMGGYENITVLHELDRPTLETMQAMDQLQATESQADLLDALVVAIHMIDSHCAKKKYIRRIFLITDGQSQCEDTDQLPEIINQLNLMDAKLNVIAVGFQEGHLTPQQEATSAIFQQLVNETTCGVYSSDTALRIYTQFRKRNIYPVAKYKGALQIGGENSIDILVYGKVKEEPLPSMKKHSTYVDFSTSIEEGLVKMSREYALEDDPTNTIVEEEDIIKAYYYGSSAVPITPADEDLLKYKTPKCMKLLGFSDSAAIPRHFYMGGVDIVLPAPNFEIPFNALVQAMFQRDEVALVKYTYRDNSEPKLAVLTPCVKPQLICLYLNFLPTYEDLREYPFNDLTESTPEQQQAADMLIDALSLESVDADGDKVELLKPSSTFNPTLQYFYQCLTFRASNPNSELPPLDPNIEEYLRPDQELLQAADQICAQFASLFVLKEVEAPTKKKKFYADALKEEANDKPNENNDSTNGEISEHNPVEDFFRLLRDRTMDRVASAITQMERLIMKYVENAFQGDTFAKAIECLKNLRQGCLDEDEIDTFNGFMTQHIQKYSIIQPEFWNLLVTSNVTLISSSESDRSTISPEEANAFLVKVEVTKIAAPAVDELLDDIE